LQEKELREHLLMRRHWPLMN